MLYAIIGLAALAVLVAWLVWRCRRLRLDLAKVRAQAHALQRDRAIRQNLQHLLERREVEIHRLRERMAAFESDYQEAQTRANDLNVSLFRESGLRILAEKEEGANRLKLEQLEQQVSDSRRKLRQQQEESAETIRRMRDLIDTQEKEIARLRRANARRIKRSPADSALENQITLEEIMSLTPDPKEDAP